MTNAQLITELLRTNESQNNRMDILSSRIDFMKNMIMELNKEIRELKESK